MAAENGEARMRVMEMKIQILERDLSTHFQDEQKFQEKIGGALEKNQRDHAVLKADLSGVSRDVGALKRIGWIIAGVILTAFIGAVIHQVIQRQFP